MRRLARSMTSESLAGGPCGGADAACAAMSVASVRDHEFSGEDGAGAEEFAAVGQESHEQENRNIDGELDPVGGLDGNCGVGEGFPKDQKDGLGGGDGPDGAVEVAALSAFAFGGRADAGEHAEGSEEKNEGAEREVTVVINLLHVPDAGEGGDEEAGEVEEGKVEDGIPGEGVADAAIERIGLVLVETEDVGAGLHAWRLAV